MTVIAFDTLAFSNKLKDAGMEAKLADVQSEEMANILRDFTINTLATKKDISELKQDIGNFKVAIKEDMIATKQDIADLKFTSQQDLKNLELKMYSFMVKMASFIVGILGGIQALFHFVQ